MFLSCELYLFIMQIPSPATVRSEQINAIKRQEVRRAKEKGMKRRRTKPPIPTRTIDMPIRDEERNQKHIKKWGCRTHGNWNYMTRKSSIWKLVTGKQ